MLPVEIVVWAWTSRGSERASRSALAKAKAQRVKTDGELGRIGDIVHPSFQNFENS
jgi:hypothetical protein